MQSSRTTQNLREHTKEHKPVKHVRSHDINERNGRRQREHSLHRNNRSVSSNFRDSIRNLASCAVVRRKPVRSEVYDEDILSSTITRQDYYHIELMNDEHPPVIPPRIPINKKHSIQIPLTTNETQSDRSLKIQSSTKEISTSLVNLMSNKSELDPVNNTTQIPTHQKIASTSAAAIDRMGLFETLSIGNTSDFIESPPLQRTNLNSMNYSSINSHGKSTTEYTWCTENLSNSIDECSLKLEIDETPLIYREQFETTEHFNWYGRSENNEPVIISYKFSYHENQQRYVTAIVRTRKRTSIERLFDISSTPVIINILRRLCEQIGINNIEHFDPIFSDGTYELLRNYDESHVSNKHKFGIIYQRENQLTEEDIFSNETHSPIMNKFLDLIGNRVQLKDFQRYRGGLDVKTDHTGTESIYEEYQNHEIMFHVSTLLPHSKIERQQLERKRHIGNDIVAIVFQENDTIFNPEWIVSQFLHVYIIITPLNTDGTQFKVSTIHRDSVPPFGPNRNDSHIFNYDQIFKHWLLTKLINAEMASYRAKTFQKYHERTKMNLFENLYQTLHKKNRSFMNFILNNSQYKHECDIEQSQILSPTKPTDRSFDNSLLGSVRRRFIPSKIRSSPNDVNRFVSKEPMSPNASANQPKTPSKHNFSTKSDKTNVFNYNDNNNPYLLDDL